MTTLLSQIEQQRREGVPHNWTDVEIKFIRQEAKAGNTASNKEVVVDA